MRGKSLLGFLALALAAQAPASAQSLTTLVKSGDTVIGIGALSGLTGIYVNNSKVWLAVADTDFADSATDGVILRNGFVTLREGAQLLAPANSILDEWISISLTEQGNLAQAIKVRTGSTVNDGLFWNMLPVALKDQIVNSPLLGPNSDWDRFDVVKMNTSNTMVVLGEIVNTAVGAANSREDSLVRYQLDSVGNIVSETVLATKEMFVDALGTTVNSLPNSEHIIDLNEHGDYITLVSGFGNINAVMKNMDTIIAQEGLPCAVPGRTWRTLSLAKVALNDVGDYLVAGAISGDSNTYLIEVSGRKFAQSGDILPNFSAQPLGTGSAAPLRLTNAGDVFWRASNNAGSADDAFMKNYDPIVQTNRTVVNGNLVTRVDIQENSFAISANGRFWAGRVELQVVGQTALFMDFGLVEELPGCFGNQGELKHVSGQALAGKTLELAMDKGQVVGALPIILFSTSQRRPGNPCGAVTPYGEVLIGQKLATLFLPSWDGIDASTTSLSIPNTLSLVDTVFYAQGAFRDTGGSSSEAFRLTNALRFEIGAP